MKPSQNLTILGPVAAILLSSCGTTPSIFDKADSNSDQKLSTAEVEDMLIEGIFINTDTNNDGLVTLAEWSAQNAGDPPTLFASRDENKDGGVTFEEFRDHASETGMFTKVATEIDTDGNGYISPAESQAALKKS